MSGERNNGSFRSNTSIKWTYEVTPTGVTSDKPDYTVDRNQVASARHDACKQYEQYVNYTKRVCNVTGEPGEYSISPRAESNAVPKNYCTSFAQQNANDLWRKCVESKGNGVARGSNSTALKSTSQNSHTQQYLTGGYCRTTSLPPK